MSHYNIRARVLFIHIPKTAGVAMLDALTRSVAETASFDKLDAMHRYRRDRALANHFPLYRIEQLLALAQMPNFPLANLRKFMVVRNPWERMLSLYFHRLRKIDASYQGKSRNTLADKIVVKAGFKQWLLTTPHEGDTVLTRMAQSEWARNSRGVWAIDDVLRFEKLDVDWLALCNDYGLTYRPLQDLNMGAEKTRWNPHFYRVRYDAETRAHVEHHFAEDIERFGYGF